MLSMYLQDASKLGVPVGNVSAPFAVREGTDDIAQGQQALVDVDALCHLLACGSCVLHPLTACQRYAKQ